MRVLGIDFETTGLNVNEARIIEMGLVLWDTQTHQPLLMHNVLLRDDTYPKLPPVITELTGISQEYLEEFGRDPKQDLEHLEMICAKYNVNYLVAHNGTNFDKPLLYAELNRHRCVATVLRSLGWIDTRLDLPFKKDPDSVKLKYLACDLGILNPFPHRAVFDVLTTLRILSQFDFQDVLNRAGIPNISVTAHVPYNQNTLAKERGYHWNPQQKLWIRTMKKDKLPAEVDFFKQHGITVTFQ